MRHTVDVAISEADYRKFVTMFGGRQAAQAAYQAVLRTTNAGTKAVADMVQAKLLIPRKYITGKNRYAAINAAVNTNANPPAGIINIKQKRIPLAAFKVSGPTKGGRGKGPVTVLVSPDRPPIVLRHAFRAFVQSAEQKALGAGHKGIFVRQDANRPTLSPKGAAMKAAGKVGKNGRFWRLPLDERFGPSVLDLVSRDDITAAATKAMKGLLQKYLDSQVSRFSRGKFRTLDAAWAAFLIKSK